MTQIAREMPSFIFATEMMYTYVTSNPCIKIVKNVSTDMAGVNIYFA